MDFTAKEALDRMMLKVKEREPNLAHLIQQAIDEGKLVSERGKLKGPNARGEHTYERRVPLSDEEALDKVLSVLRSHLVEMPHCTTAALDELASTDIGATGVGDATSLPLFAQGEKQPGLPQSQRLITIERDHEGMLQRDEPVPAVHLKRFSAEELTQQKANLEALAKILGRP